MTVISLERIFLAWALTVIPLCFIICTNFNRSLSFIIFSVFLVTTAISSTLVSRAIPARANFILRYFPNDTRIADKITAQHTSYFGNIDNARRLENCKDDILVLLEEYTVGSMVNFVECKTKIPQPESDNDIYRLKAIYQ